MRLYLSSQRLGDAPEELVLLMRGRVRIGLVGDGAYLDDPAKQLARVADEIEDLRDLGLDPVEVDLRDGLDGLDAVWVLGGDAVALLEAFTSTGLDDVVRGRLRDDSLVYAGYSAGACLLGPAFPGRDGVLTHGLGLVPFTIAPHGGPGQLLAWFDGHDIPHRTLHDGQAIVVDGDVTRLVGG